MGFTYDAPPPKEEEKTEEWVNVTLGIFLDGTLNNKTNTEARLEAENGGSDQAKINAFKKSKSDETSSYYNDYSNVARLFYFYDENFAIYIEGIGTEDLKKDTMNGYAFGAGPTGVRGKVRKGCEMAVEKVKDLAPKKKVDTLTFDVFGFSRGAAASRNFVYEVSKSAYKPIPFWVSVGESGYFTNGDADKQPVSEEELPAKGHLGLMLKKSNIEVKNIVVRFLGIYDTVSSYHEGPSITINVLTHKFDNDEEELNLQGINKAQRVVHFTAKDEHRKNFALTKVHRKNEDKDFADYKAPIVIERQFPGVHCDIGGAYKDNEVETVKEIDYKVFGTEHLENERRRLIEEGWYSESQITVEERLWSYNYLTGTRTLSNKYSFIPLHFMCEFALKYNKPLPFKKTQLENKFALKNGGAPNAFLEDVKKRLRDYIFKNGKEPLIYKTEEQFKAEYNPFIHTNQEHGAIVSKFLQEQEVLRTLRNEYLHWSANYKGFGMEPQLKDMEEPNMVGDRRVRQTFLKKD